MSNLVLLFVINFAFLLFALFISHCDISSPSVLFFASFCIMLFLANIFQWFFNFRIKDDTFWIIVSADALFFLVENIYNLFQYGSYKFRAASGSTRLMVSVDKQPITISKTLQYCIVVFEVLVILASYYRVVNYGDAREWSEQIRQFKMASVMNEYSSKSPLLDFFVNNATKVIRTSLYVIMYIIIYNKAISGIRLRQNKALVIILILYIPMTIIQGARQPIVELIISGILIYVMLKKQRRKLKLFKLLFFSIILLSILIPLFSKFAGIVGRGEKERAALQYVATYFCSGLKIFDESIVGHPCSTKYFGQSTFSGLYNYLIVHYHVLPPAEDLSFHKTMFLGCNTITIFGRWYEDFGTAGVIVMTIIVSLFFSWLHGRAMNRRTSNLTCIIYVQQAMALVLAAYDDRITYLMRPANILDILLIWIFYRILIGGSRYHFTFGTAKQVYVK